MSQTIEYISIDQIKPNRYQPRKSFADDALLDLAQSIRENGLIQPIVVRKKGKMFEIIAGERRYRASQMAGLVEVPCVLTEVTDEKSAVMALVENVQRENLSAIEEAKAYMKILKENELTQEELAMRMGKAQSTLANKLRLLELSPKIQKAVNAKQITERHARALLNLPVDKRTRALNQIVKKSMTVRQTEEYIEKLNHPTPKHQLKPHVRGYSKQQQLAVNTIKQAIEMSKKVGIKFDVEEVETDKDRRIIIKFPKED